MDIKRLYNKFYFNYYNDETEIGKRNLRSLKEKINSLVIEGNLQNDIDTLEKHIETIKSNKYGCVNSYNKFLTFLKSEGYEIKSSLKKNYETTTRRIELIKYLQTPKSREEILKEFLINRRTLDTDFAEIEKGIEFFGFPLKIKLSSHEREGRRTIDDEEEKYCSSCNPFGLALNMTELYLLLKVIPNQLKVEKIRNGYMEIISKIYPQLTQHSKDLLKIEDRSINNMYEVEFANLKRNVDFQLSYFMKTEKLCTIIYNDNGEVKELRGKIRYNKEDEYTFIVEHNKKQTIINYIDYLSIKDFKDLYN